MFSESSYLDTVRRQALHGDTVRGQALHSGSPRGQAGLELRDSPGSGRQVLRLKAWVATAQLLYPHS